MTTILLILLMLYSRELLGLSLIKVRAPAPNLYHKYLF